VNEMSSPKNISDLKELYDKTQPNEMTWQRKLSLKLTSYNWYYNEKEVREKVNRNLSQFRRSSDLHNQSDVEVPRLELAWTFFEYFSLPRKYTNRAGNITKRAPPGFF